MALSKKTKLFTDKMAKDSFPQQGVIPPDRISKGLNIIKLPLLKKQ